MSSSSTGAEFPPPNNNQSYEAGCQVRAWCSGQLGIPSAHVSLERSDRTEAAAEVDIDDVHFGLLLGRLGSRRHSGAIRVEFRRTQEIELILGIVLTGAGVLATSYLKTLGSEFAKWTVDEL